MYVHWKRFLIGALVACTGLVAGCGSDSTPGPAAVITGKAVKGPVKGATVEVYAMKADGKEGEKIGTATTSDVAGKEGEYSVPVSKATGPVIIKIIGTATSKYIDETGGETAFGTTDSIRAAVPEIADIVAAKQPVAVTPLTEVAVQQVPGFLVSTADLKKAVFAGNLFVQQTFGITDVLQVPANFNDTSATSADAKAYATALGVIAQLVKTETKLLNAINVLNNLLSATAATHDAAQAKLNTALTGLQAAVTLDTALLTQFNNTVVAAVSAPLQKPDLSDTTAPSVPAGLTATSATGSAVVLTWTASTDASGVALYNVFRNGVRIGDSRSTTFTDTTVSTSKTYSYTVNAVDKAGNVSAASAALSVTTPATTGPGLNVTAGGSVN